MLSFLSYYWEHEMSKIDLGGTLAKNKPLLKGLVSGIDSEALIENLVAKKTDAVKVEQDTITFNTEKIAAFSVLANKVSALQDALSGLRGDAIASDAPNLFDSKKVSIAAAEVDNAQNFLSITAGPDAHLSNISVNVQQIAQNKIIGSSYFTSPGANATNPTSDHSNTSLFTPGTFTINGVNITISDGATLSDIEYAINSVSSQSNVSASITQISSTQYSLFLTSNLTGTAHDIVISDPDNCLNNLFSGAPIQAAQDAIINVQNIGQITRSTNVITDFLEGVTFELYAPTNYMNAGGISTAFSASVSIYEDSDASISGVSAFVDAYNDFIKFTTIQQGRDALGNYHDDARIQQNEIISTLVDDVISTATQLVYAANSSLGIGLSLKSVAADGNEPEYQHLLEFNSEDYKTACNNDFARVKNLFEFNGYSSSTNLVNYARGNGVTSGTLQVNFDAAQKSASVIYNGQTIACDYTATNASDPTKGGLIKGKVGTILEGYEFKLLNASSNLSANYTLSQGVGDKIYNLCDDVLDFSSSDGMSQIQREISYIASDNTLRSENIKQKLEKIDDYREGLIMKYSRLEANIARANTLLMMIDAQLSVMSKK